MGKAGRPISNFWLRNGLLVSRASSRHVSRFPAIASEMAGVQCRGPFSLPGFTVHRERLQGEGHFKYRGVGFHVHILGLTFPKLPLYDCAVDVRGYFPAGLLRALTERALAGNK